jgi:hypothetical protein
VIWVCVSPSFNLNKLLEDIKKYIPSVEGEKGDRPEELIEQRLKSKRFLLVLDDTRKYTRALQRENKIYKQEKIQTIFLEICSMFDCFSAFQPYAIIHSTYLFPWFSQHGLENSLKKKHGLENNR